MNYIIELIQVSFTVFFSVIFIINKRYKPFTFLYPLVTFLGCAVAIVHSYSAYIMFPLYFILYLFIPLFLSKAKKTIILYISLFSVCFVSFVNSLVNLLLYYFSCPNIEIATVIISSLFFLILLVVLLKNSKLLLLIKKLFTISTSVNLIIILFLGLFFVLLLIENLALVLPQKKIIFALSFITILLLLGCFIVIAFLVSNNIKKLYYKRTNQILNNNIEQQVKHYENTLRAYDNLRTFKHDFNNLKIGLNNLLKENKTEEAIQYLNASNAITEYEQIIKTGNSTIDAIISNKHLELQHNDIHISFSGIVPYDALEISDLCIAFGNALDNAIEACINIKTDCKKTISICVKQKNNLLIIKIINPVSKKIEINNNMALTSKGDTSSHGIGLYSINSMVKKYNGFYKISCSDEYFTIEMGFFIKNVQI